MASYNVGNHRVTREPAPEKGIFTKYDRIVVQGPTGRVEEAYIERDAGTKREADLVGELMRKTE